MMMHKIQGSSMGKIKFTAGNAKAAWTMFTAPTRSKAGFADIFDLEQWASLAPPSVSLMPT